MPPPPPSFGCPHAFHIQTQKQILLAPLSPCTPSRLFSPSATHHARQSRPPTCRWTTPDTGSQPPARTLLPHPHRHPHPPCAAAPRSPQSTPTRFRFLVRKASTSRYPLRRCTRRGGRLWSNHRRSGDARRTTTSCRGKTGGRRCWCGGGELVSCVPRYGCCGYFALRKVYTQRIASFRSATPTRVQPCNKKRTRQIMFQIDAKSTQCGGVTRDAFTLPVVRLRLGTGFSELSRFVIIVIIISVNSLSNKCPPV